MTCDEIERDEIAERYLSGRLGEEASADFEAHYFDCSRCLEHVGRLESARHALAGDSGAGADARRWRRRLWPAAGALAAAAVLILAVRVIDEPSAPPNLPVTRDVDLPREPAAPDLGRLGAIEPPRFTPPRLRSGAGEARRVFLDAMQWYERGDYAGAVPGLEAAVRADPAYPAAHFFLGVCSLQLDRRADAIRYLREAARLGESPYLEDAHFFLAKALIRDGDVETARGELRTVLALEGDRRDEASRLLAELP